MHQRNALCHLSTQANTHCRAVSLLICGQVDIWAAGVLAWELLVGKPPFEQSNSRMAFEQILSMEPDFPDWMSANARSFIQAALCKDARSRPTARQLLLHRWLQPGARRRSRTVTQPVVGSGMGNFAEPCSLSECSSPPRPAARVSPSPSSDSQTPHSRAPLPERSSPVRRPPSGVLSDDSALASPPVRRGRSRQNRHCHTQPLAVVLSGVADAHHMRHMHCIRAVRRAYKAQADM